LEGLISSIFRVRGRFGGFNCGSDEVAEGVNDCVKRSMLEIEEERLAEGWGIWLVDLLEPREASFPLVGFTVGGGLE